MRAVRPRTVKFALVFVYLFVHLVCLAQLPTTRDGILNDVRQRAHAHAESGASKDSKLILDLYDPNPAGLSRQQLLDVYDREYTQAKRSDWKPKAGWIVAGILVIAIVFLERLKNGLGKLIDFAGRQIFDLLAGIPWFYRLPLQKYCRLIVERHRKLKIPFRPERPLDLTAVFVPLKVTDSPGSAEAFDVYTSIGPSTKLVVTGSPGSGKSILMRHIALTWASRYLAGRDRRNVPILVELNRLNDPAVTLRSELSRELATKGFPKPDRFLDRALEKGTLMLLLDGLDEISAARRPAVLLQIRDLATQFSNIPFIVSCRTQVYNGELGEVVDKTLEIQSFTDQQIRRFLRAWAADMRVHGKSVEQLMRALLERPTIMALARNPLMMTIIAWLYTDTPTIVLPHSRSAFYGEATDLLLYKWKPETNTFQLTPKQFVLRDLALLFQDAADQQHSDRRSMSIQAVLESIVKILPTLNLNSAESATPLLNEVVQRSGLLLAIDGGERYQFAHLTLQEYFAANALKASPSGLIARFRKDPDAWREPVKLWCGLDVDATGLIQAIYQIDPLTGFECLADAQKIDPAATSLILADMKQRLLSSQNDDAIIKAFGSVASSLSDRGKALFQWLSAQSAPQALDALSYTNMPQAAAVIARLYPTDPAARPLLIRFQELAIPHLEVLARDGSLNAVDDLLTIGTPGAAEALVPLLWHPLPLTARNAAIALATLFPSPEVFSGLAELTLNHPAEYPWVWRPFAQDEKSPIPIIAGRIAVLLQAVDPNPDLPRTQLDPRLLLPLLCRDNMTWAHQGSIQSLLTPEQTKLLLTMTPIVPVDPSAESSSDVAPITNVDIFNQLSSDSNALFLFDRLPPLIQIGFLRGIHSTRIPNQDDWENLFNPVPRPKRGGWHLWLAAALIQAVALADLAVLWIHRRAFSFAHIPGTAMLWALAAGLLIYIGLSVIGFVADEENHCHTLRMLSGGPFFVKAHEVDVSVFNPLGRPPTWQTLKDLFAVYGMGLLIIVASPSWIVATFLVLHLRLNAILSILTIVLYFCITAWLWRIANNRYRLSKNPLSGLRDSLRTGAAGARPSTSPGPLRVPSIFTTDAQKPIAA
jgi:hypothetical protein